MDSPANKLFPESYAKVHSTGFVLCTKTVRGGVIILILAVMRNTDDLTEVILSPFPSLAIPYTGECEW